MNAEKANAAENAPSPWILLDASCLLNLYAARRTEEILRAYPARFGFVTKVREESLYVCIGGDGEDAEGREAVDLTSFLESGLLTEFRPDAAEIATFVAFAARLDDGEAMTCAVAVHRHLAVAIDERKARNFLAIQAPMTTTYRTLDIVYHWATSESVTSLEVKQTLRDIRERGRFFPGRGDPHKGWWDSIIRL